MNSSSALDPLGKNIVFVVGCPRSGTTWLHRLIASHRQIVTGQESNLFDFYIGPQLRVWRGEPQYFDKRGPNGLHCYLKEEEFIARIRAYALSLLDKVGIQDGQYFLEKTPSHVCFIKEILEIFPRSKIIIIYRHPFGVIPSLTSAGRSWGRNWAPRGTFRAMQMWKSYARCALQNRELVPEAQLYEIDFDRLSDNGPAALMEIFKFIGLDVTLMEARAYIEENVPGRNMMTAIPLYGAYADQKVTEPEGFFRKDKRDRHLSRFWKQVVRILCRKEMSVLKYV